MAVEEATERVTMVWPKALKDLVREKSAGRGMTEYIMEATQLHLGVADDLGATTLQLNEAKHLVQLLADRLVMGGEHDDRLQALMAQTGPQKALWSFFVPKTMRLSMAAARTRQLRLCRLCARGHAPGPAMRRERCLGNSCSRADGGRRSAAALFRGTSPYA